MTTATCCVRNNTSAVLIASMCVTEAFNVDLSRLVLILVPSRIDINPSSVARTTPQGSLVFLLALSFTFLVWYHTKWEFSLQRWFWPWSSAAQTPSFFGLWPTSLTRLEVEVGDLTFLDLDFGMTERNGLKQPVKTSCFLTTAAEIQTMERENCAFQMDFFVKKVSFWRRKKFNCGVNF